MTSSPIPTVDEIVSSLKRSFIPTILIEGTDDVFIYRWLKKNISINPISLQPCGGRTNLFAIHDRQDEFRNSNVLFVADKDSFRFHGIPESRKDIIFTSGYCIENDIYDGSRVSTFIDDSDRPGHDLLKEIIGRWFAFELKMHLDSNGANPLNVATHINVVSPIGTNCMCPVYSRKINYSEPSEDEISVVTNEYDLNVRGKQLFQMLSRFLSAKGRFSNFSDKNLIEIALKQGQNHHLDRLVTDMNNQLATSMP